MIINKPVTVAIGISLCGISWYLIYRYFKKDEDDYEDSFIKASEFKTLEIKVPKHLAREIIGRNGKNIKNVQEISGAKINFKNNDDEEDRICVIKGTIASCHIAENIIRDFIENQPVIETEDLMIPRSATGKIIGRCGENIADMQSASGAKIMIPPDSKNKPEVRVIIKGTEEQRVVAKFLIMEKVNNVQNTNMNIETILSKREPRAPPKSVSNADNVDSSQTSRDSMAPVLSQQETPFEVYVSAIVDPSKFWIQIVGPKATELDQLVEEMTEYYTKPENKTLYTLDSVSKGDLVAAVFQYDKKWYRAEVLDVQENKGTNKDTTELELYYVDYGDTDIVPLSEIFELRTDFLQLHFQAIECYLANVDAVGGKWSEEATDKFEEWTHVAQWKKLSAKINGYCVRDRMRASAREGSPVPGIDLYDYSNEKDVNIAEELVNHGFAIFKTNPTFSKTSNV